MLSKSGNSQYVVFVILGVIVGAFSGLFGVGGGIIIIPSLVLLLGLAQQTAQGVSVAFMIPVSLMNAWAYYKHGATDAANLPLILALVAGGIPAGYLGSTLANSLPAATLKGMFAIFMVAVAVRMMPAATFKYTGAGALVGVLLIAIGIRLAFMK